VHIVERDFDIDSFLTKPLVGHLATYGAAGPCETPVWFLWEDGALWMIASSESGFVKRLREDSRAAIGIVDFDVNRGYLRHVGFRGSVAIEPMDAPRRERLVRRYLGDETQWSAWFRQSVVERQDVLLKFVPQTAVARDQSYFRYGDSNNRLPALERVEFLREWHARYPGATSATFGCGRIVDDGRSSYALLADDVAALPGMKVAVDLACGDGYLLAMLADRFPSARLIGVDMTPEELELARSRRLAENVNLVAARADALPFDRASVDAAVCHMALMLFDDAHSVIGELARVIRPDGMFAAVLGPAPGSSALVARYGALLHEAEAAEKLPPLRVGDAATYTEESLRALFSNDVWSDVRVDDTQLSFERPDEQMAVLSGMYNVARLSDSGRAELQRQLRAEVLNDRQAGKPAECILGLRHVIARRSSSSSFDTAPFETRAPQDDIPRAPAGSG
jgi:SAM-dependent methyltransferase/nitroimidazol reductase NimA-like FMN-containing flavoprotein (pyridoxamine 5'-phosphate oxidase superfamily)